MAGSASVEAEDEFVEVALEMLSSQAVIDADHPGLGVGEGAVDPGQNDMGGRGADDMGLVPDVGGAGIGRPAVGFDRRAEEAMTAGNCVVFQLKKLFSRLMNSTQYSPCGSRITWPFKGPRTASSLGSTPVFIFSKLYFPSGH